jgi:RecA-family ATPase
MQLHRNPKSSVNQAPAGKRSAPDILPLMTLRELFDEPEEHAQWLVDELLPTGGFSALTAKPKVGKSHLVRQLSLDVALGRPFLGRATTQGPVLYVAMQEKASEVRLHFDSMGATGDEPLHLHIGRTPEDAINWLRVHIERVRPVLASLDTLFRFIRVENVSGYAEMSNMLSPLLDLARETGTHILATHHATKKGKGTDSILGSIDIFGEVDTALMMERTESHRTISSDQRYGENLPESILEWNPETRTMSLKGSKENGTSRKENGAARQDAELDHVYIDIMLYLSRQEDFVTREQIEAHAEASTASKRQALKELVDGQFVARIGTGRRGDPYRYCDSEKDYSPNNGLFACSVLPG